MWCHKLRNMPACAGKSVVCGWRQNGSRKIRVKALCVSRKRKGSLEIKSNREVLQTAEKLLECAISKGNEKLSLVLSKLTDLRKCFFKTRSKPPFFYFFGKKCEDTTVTVTLRENAKYIQSIIDSCCFEKLRKITNTIKLTSNVSSGELFKNLKCCFHRMKTV